MSYPSLGTGPHLDLDAGALTTSYVGGTAFRLRGTEAVEARCTATFDGGTTLTSIRFRLEVSDDGSTWDPVAEVTLADGSVSSEIVFLAASGTASGRISTTSHRAAAYVRLAAKHVGGAPAGADAASAVMSVIRGAL